MIDEVIVFGQVATIVVALVASLATIGVLTTRSILKAKNRTTVLPERNDARLEQLQQSIDAIAVEVERIAEAQRFSARLLAERGEAPAKSDSAAVGVRR